MKKLLVIFSVIPILCTAQIGKRWPDIDSIFRTANEKYEKSQYAESYEDFTYYLLRYTTNGPAFYNRGLCSYSLGEYRKAISDFKLSVQYSYKDWTGYEMLGSSYTALEKYDSAVVYFDSSLAINKKNYKVLSYKARALVDLGKNKEAKANLKRSMAINNSFEPAYYTRGRMKFNLLDYKGSLKDFNKALTLVESNETRLWIGANLINLGLQKKAIEQYDQIVFKDPKDARAYRNRCLAKLKLQQNELALKDVEHSLSIDSTQSNAWCDKGIAQYRLKKYSEAIPSLERSLVCDSTSYLSYSYIGYCYYYLGDKDKALEYLNKFLALSQNESYGYYFRGKILYERSDYKAAIEDCDRSIKIEEGPDNYYIRGVSKYMSNAYKEAIADLTKSIHFNKTNSNSYGERGVNYYQLKKYKKALKDLNKSIQLDHEEGRMYYYRGLVLVAKGKSQLACEDFKSAAKLNYSEAKEALSKYGCSN